MRKIQKRIYLVLAVLIFGLGARAQSSSIQFIYTGNNTYEFNADAFLMDYLLSYSNVAPNATLDNFKYLWTFGDGYTSTNMHPVHQYLGDPGGKEITVTATPIHVPIPRPTRPTITMADGSGTGWLSNPAPVYHQTLGLEEQVRIEMNCEPRYNYESTVILTYKNSNSVAANVAFEFELNTAHFNLIDIMEFQGDMLLTDVMNTNSGLFDRKLSFITTTPLLPGEERKILFDVLTKSAAIGVVQSSNPVVITTSPTLYFKASSNAGISGGSNCSHLYNTKAVGAWDPNTKIVSHPFLLKKPLNQGDEITLRYRINFENMGNDATQSVQVYDAISPLLDITSIDLQNIEYKYKYAQHSFTPYVSNSNELIVDFANLELAGANNPNTLNIEDSKFWFEFDINLKQDAWNAYLSSLPSGPAGSVAGEFGEHAVIQFDNNEAIETNKGVTQVIISDRRIGDIESLKPNPTRDITQVDYSLEQDIDGRKAYFYLTDLNSGGITKLTNVVESKRGSYSTRIDVSGLKHGTYLIGIHTAEGTFNTLKLIKI